MDKEVYIIYTLPRSGSTLFGDLLKDNDSICYRGEAKVFYKIIDWIPLTLLGLGMGKLLRRIYLSGGDKMIYIDKSPTNVLRYKKLSFLFPAHKKIVLHRNLVDVRRSIYNEWKNIGNPKDSIRARRAPFLKKMVIYFKKEYVFNRFVLKSIMAPVAIIAFISLGCSFISNQMSYFRLWGPKVEYFRLVKKFVFGDDYLIDNQVRKLEDALRRIEADMIVEYDDLRTDGSNIVKRLVYETGNTKLK